MSHAKSFNEMTPEQQFAYNAGRQYEAELLYDVEAALQEERKRSAALVAECERMREALKVLYPEGRERLREIAERNNAAAIQCYASDEELPEDHWLLEDLAALALPEKPEEKK